MNKDAEDTNPSAKQPVYKRRWFKIAAPIAAILVIAGACSENSENDRDASSENSSSSEAQSVSKRAHPSKEAKAHEERERKETEDSEAHADKERKQQEQEAHDKEAEEKEAEADEESYGKDFEAWWLEQNGASSWDDIAARYPGGWEGHVLSVTSSKDTLFIVTNLAKTGDGKDLAKQARDGVANVVSFDSSVPDSVKNNLEFIQIVNPQQQVLAHGGLEYAD